MPGRLFVGTSGFAYPSWSPRFYPPALHGDALLPYYAARLGACELNNTFYRRPTEERARAWAAATPSDFRFVVKAQRGGSFRALVAGAQDAVGWLTEPLSGFGTRLGSVLFRVPATVQRDDERLARLVTAWPADVPLTVEFEDPSWQVDEVFAILAARAAVLCATELPDDPEPPALRLTGPFLYLRLRRHRYEPGELEAWAARIAPFLDAGTDVFAFFRHDEEGAAPGFALALAAALDAVPRDVA